MQQVFLDPWMPFEPGSGHDRFQGDRSRSRKLPACSVDDAVSNAWANGAALANLSAGPADRLPNIDPAPGRETSDEPDRDRGADARSP